MAHFAQLENNVVIRVIVIANEDILDGNGNESESVGQAFCQQFGEGTYLQTSYNESFRKNYAGIGCTYDAEHDAFIPVKPVSAKGWVLNQETFKWEEVD